MEKIIQEKTNEIKKLNQNLSELVSKIDEMHKENLNIGNEYTIFKKQINDLCDEYISIYNNYYQNYNINEISKLSLMDSPEIKIKNIIISSKNLLNKFNSLNESLTKSNLIIQSYENKINELNENNNVLKDTLDEINRENINKSYSYINQNEEMNYKLKQANNLLEESNKGIQKIKEENKQLKQQNMKLEKNLEMLTRSHEEMEKNISINKNLSNEKIEDSQRKTNQLLKELEFKDRQIKSLENYINQINSSNNSNNHLLIWEKLFLKNNIIVLEGII